MNDSILIQFFDDDFPCPEQIPHCERLREEYKRELKKLSAAGCSQCQKTGLKSKYMEAIWTKNLSSLISKASS
jgi:hypothetical protein